MSFLVASLLCLAGALFAHASVRKGTYESPMFILNVALAVTGYVMSFLFLTLYFASGGVPQ